MMNVGSGYIDVKIVTAHALSFLFFLRATEVSFWEKMEVFSCFQLRHSNNDSAEYCRHDQLMLQLWMLGYESICF